MRPQPRKPGGSRPRCGTRANIDASFFHDPATKAVLKERGRVLMGLLRFHNVNRGAYPGQSKLADESGLPVRSVRRALRELEEADLIRRDGRYRGRARYRLPVSGKNYLKGGADKWDTECAVSTPKSAQFRPPRVRDIDPPGVRDIAHLLNWNHNASRSRTHKEHINTDASILEASQETPSSRGKEESTLPPGAVSVRVSARVKITGGALFSIGSDWWRSANDTSSQWGPCHSTDPKTTNSDGPQSRWYSLENSDWQTIIVLPYTTGSIV